MSQRETIEFGYTDAQGNKRVYKQVDVTDMTESEIRFVKNTIYKEMYAFIADQVNNIGAYDEDEDEIETEHQTLQRQLDNLESQVRVYRRDIDQLKRQTEAQANLIGALKDMLKEAWTNGN